MTLEWSRMRRMITEWQLWVIPRDCWNYIGIVSFAIEWHSNDGMEQGKKSEQILIASIPVHPVILEPSWDDSRMTEWLGLGFKPMEFLHPCPSRHPQSSEEWLRQERMTKNDEKFRSKAVALDFFPPLHPVILVSFHHKNGHPYTIPSFSCHPVIQRSQNMEAWR